MKEKEPILFNLLGKEFNRDNVIEFITSSFNFIEEISLVIELTPPEFSYSLRRAQLISLCYLLDIMVGYKWEGQLGDEYEKEIKDTIELKIKEVLEYVNIQRNVFIPPNPQSN